MKNISKIAHEILVLSFSLKYVPDYRDISKVISRIVSGKSQVEKFIITTDKDHYDEDERTIEFKKKDNKIIFEFNADLDYVKDYITLFGETFNYKYDFKFEKPINTTYGTIYIDKKSSLNMIKKNR